MNAMIVGLLCAGTIVWSAVSLSKAQAAGKPDREPVRSSTVVKQPSQNPLAARLAEARAGSVKSSGSSARQEKKSEAKNPRGKEARKVRLKQERRAKVFVEPRTSSVGHGLLTDTQRYDPRPAIRQLSVPHPGTTELVHDHFQELDRNQDGKVDPIERAFGRLDIDQDLGSR